MADHKKIPGIMLVHPRHKPHTPDIADKFLKWTKMHYRDLTVLPTDPVYGGMTQCLRFSAPTDSKYTHDPENGTTPNWYTCVIDDIAFLKTDAYVNVSRALDLENTPDRPLLDGEEPVGQPGMVFDICDARFAVYEDIATGSKLPSYQTLPVTYTTPATFSHKTPPPSRLIGVSVKSSPSQTADALIALQTALTDAYPPGSTYKVYTSLYKFIKEAQPAYHPEIITDDSTNWLAVVLLIKDGGELPERKAIEEKVEKEVAEWAKGVEGVEPSFGVWDGEVWFGRAELFP